MKREGERRRRLEGRSWVGERRCCSRASVTWYKCLVRLIDRLYAAGKADVPELLDHALQLLPTAEPW